MPREVDAMFDLIQQGDVLLHHPFDAFTPVLELIRQAAEDPNVLAIKQTLYRTGKESAIVDSLMQAARNGKDVTVVVELRARFDEEANLGLADRLQDAGVQVVYGVVGYKTHAKMLLIVRREGKSLRRYVHLGTGNYHSGTARAYTDFSLMTADPDIGNDVHLIFQQLSGLAAPLTLKHLLQSPFTLHKGVLERIERETAHARAGRPGRIVAKMNALNEPQVMRALVRGLAGRRADRPDRARRLHLAGRHRACRRTSGCARSSVASSNTIAIWWFGNDGAAGAVLLQRRLAGAQPAAAGGNRVPDPRRRSCARACTRKACSTTWPTTRTRGRCSPTAATPSAFQLRARSRSPRSCRCWTACTRDAAQVDAVIMRG
jgi:polyphosphate kinase